MAKQVQVMILRTAGTNCDRETARAFEACGAKARLTHVNHVMDGTVPLRDFQILAIPGGFTYGDDIESGRILANELSLKMGDALRELIREGKLILGICNGFQVLVKAGLLPNPSESASVQTQTVTLTHNDSGKFEARWVHLRPSGNSVWIRGMEDVVFLPVAHAEGKFVADAGTLKELNDNGQVAFRYCSMDGRLPVYPSDPNGSMEHIAGITDRSGRILGMMPHPERHFDITHHPSWTRNPGRSGRGQGARIFQNGVDYARECL
jgi:phosphoribosylformylglycinamidine synthase subunit PurQ / glutaminase